MSWEAREERMMKLCDNMYSTGYRLREKGEDNAALLRLLRKHFDAKVWMISGSSTLERSRASMCDKL